MTIAALSSKAVRATLIGLLIFFAGYMLADVFAYTDRSLGLVQMISLHPVAAFSYGLDQIGSLEDNGVGLTSDSIDFSENESGYQFRNTMNMLFVDCIVWGLLAWYFNRIIPPDYGQALPWYFPFSAEFWSSGNVHGAVSDTSVATKIAHSGIPYEAVSDSLKRQTEEGKSIEIHNLRKIFGDKMAVDNLNLSIYRGQITALLGHNGEQVAFVWRSVPYHVLPSTDRDYR
jgi:ATP-binding cassette, subfamily A (ABC1), member 3